MKQPIGEEFAKDLEIIARRMPGRGAALGRLFAHQKVQRIDAGAFLGVKPSAVTHWVKERRWPDRETIVKLLAWLNVDQKLLSEATSIMFGNDGIGEVFPAQRGLNAYDVSRDQIIGMLKDHEPFEQLTMIFNAVIAPAYLALGLRAAGRKGGEACDPKACQILFHEYRLHLEESRRRQNDTAPRAQVGLQAQWAAGDVTEPAAEPDQAVEQSGDSQTDDTTT